MKVNSWEFMKYGVLYCVETAGGEPISFASEGTEEARNDNG